MANGSIPQSARTQAALKAWETRRLMALAPKPANYDQRLEALYQRRDNLSMLIADSGVTTDIRNLYKGMTGSLRSIESVCDRIYENAPRATALSRCDGSPAEVLDILETDAQHRKALRQVNCQMNNLTYWYL